MTKARFVSTPTMDPVRADQTGEAREVAAARALGLELQELVRERPLSKTWAAKGPGADAPRVGLVVVGDGATDAEHLLFARMAERAGAPGGAIAGVLRVEKVAPAGDAFVTDLWTAGSARDLPALGWTTRERAGFVRRVVSTLEALHAAGIVHGCLCSSNVLLDGDLRPVLAEVGTISPGAIHAGGAGRSLYAAFAAPEVKAGRAADFRSDVYSAGRLLEAVLQGSAAPATAALVKRCTSEDPAARYPSAAALGAALDAVVDDLLASGPVSTTASAASTADRQALTLAPPSSQLSQARAPRPPPPAARRGRLLVGIAIVVVVAAVLITALRLLSLV